jgi:hypothetical protein
MNPTRFLHPTDLRGLARLATDSVDGAAHLTEQLHGTILAAAPPLGRAVQGPTRGIPGLVYRSVRGINGLVRASIDGLARPLVAALPAADSSPAREHWLAALNGVLGDRLAAGDNPLAIEMTLRQAGRPLVVERQALARAFERPSRRVLVAVHGLCMNDLHWGPSDLPGRIGRRAGFTPLYLHYNSGRSVADNGRAFADLLEALVAEWPVAVEEIAIIGHSMGGLVARSARAWGIRSGHRWPQARGRMVFLATPHLGSPVERAGNGIDTLLGASPYSAPFRRLAAIRSAGIRDLRTGLPPGEALQPKPGAVERFALAATARGRSGRLGSGLLGDGLVPIDSALGRDPDPERALALPAGHCRVIEGAGHLGLIHHPATLRQLLGWLR